MVEQRIVTVSLRPLLNAAEERGVIGNRHASHEDGDGSLEAGRMRPDDCAAAAFPAFQISPDDQFFNCRVRGHFVYLELIRQIVFRRDAFSFGKSACADLRKEAVDDFPFFASCCFHCDASCRSAERGMRSVLEGYYTAEIYFCKSIF